MTVLQLTCPPLNPPFLQEYDDYPRFLCPVAGCYVPWRLGLGRLLPVKAKQPLVTVIALLTKRVWNPTDVEGLCW